MSATGQTLQQTLERVHRHRTTIEEIIRITRCPGVSYGILYNHAVADLQSFGRADASQGTPVTSTTVFGISSLTKAFTATACALLEGDGVLDWDTPLRQYLPAFAPRACPRLAAAVTVADLARHLTGLPDPYPLYIGVDGALRSHDEESLLRLVNHVHADDDHFRTSWTYNSLTYALLGLVIEKLSGLSFAEYMQAEVFSPLGLENTSVMAPPRGDRRPTADQAVPYVVIGETTVRAIPVRGHQPGDGFAASLGMQSSAEDLLKWAQAVIEAANGGEAPAAKSPRLRLLAAIRRTIEPACPIQVRPDGLMSYCAGWFHTTGQSITFDIFYDPAVGAIDPAGQPPRNESRVQPPETPAHGQGAEVAGGRSILYSNGYMEGWSANLHIYPQLGHAVVVLGNSSGRSEPCGYISRLLTAVVCRDEVEPDLVKLLEEEVEEFAGQWDALHKELCSNRRLACSSASPTFTGISGCYRSPQIGLQMTIVDSCRPLREDDAAGGEQNGALWLLFGAQTEVRLPLWHYHDDVFCFFPPKEDVEKMNIPLFEDWSQYLLHMYTETEEPSARGLWWQYDRAVDALWFSRETDVCS